MTDWCARIGKSSRLAGYGLRGTVEGQVPTQAPLLQASSSPSISGYIGRSLSEHHCPRDGSRNFWRR
jgi:hypothetical protein